MKKFLTFGKGKKEEQALLLSLMEKMEETIGALCKHWNGADIPADENPAKEELTLAERMEYAENCLNSLAEKWDKERQEREGETSGLKSRLSGLENECLSQKREKERLSAQVESLKRQLQERQAALEEEQRKAGQLRQQCGQAQDALKEAESRREQAEQRYEAERKKVLDAFRAMIHCRDQVQAQLLYAKRENSRLASDLLSGFLKLLSSTLENQGVEEIGQEEKFDSHFQRIVSTVPTDNPAEHLRVASTERYGYRYQGRLIREQEVVVFQYQGDRGAH